MKRLDAAAVKRKLDVFLDGPFFLLALGLLIAIFWIARIQSFAMGFLVALVGLLLLSEKHGKAVLATGCMFVMCVSDISVIHKTSFWIMVAVLGSIAAGCFIYRLVRIFQKPVLTLGSLFWGLVAAAGVSMLGGIGYSYRILNVLKTFGWCFAGFAFYFFFVNMVHGNLARWVAQLAVVSAAVVLVEVVAFYTKVYLVNGSWQDVLQSFRVKNIDLAWALSNTAAVMFALGIPFCMYLATASKFNFLYLILSVLFYLGIVFTFSRANLLFVTLLYFPILIYTFCITKYKGRFLFVFTLGAALLALMVYVFFDEIAAMLVYFINRGLDSSGRIWLYEESVRLFLENPIFGIGVFSLPDPYNLKVNWFMSHQTLLQILLNFGLVGLVGYAFFFWKKYTVFFRKISRFKMFAFLAVLLVELHGMLDVTFSVIYYTFYVFAFCIAAEKEPEGEREPAFRVEGVKAAVPEGVLAENTQVL